MATTYEAKSFQGGIAVGANTFPGVIKRAYSANLEDTTADATYAFIINDLIKFYQLPPYVKVLDAAIVSGDAALDDHATPTLDLDVLVSDGTTTKTAVNGGTAINQANVTANMDKDADNAYLFVTTNDDFYVALKAIAASAGDAASGATVAVEISYTGLLEPGEVAMRSARDNTPG